MKWNKLNAATLAVAASAVVLAGCAYPNGEPNNTGTGMLTGAAVGAASGAVIGGRNAGAGALIGGAIGAIAGGLIGSSMDEQQREYLRQQAPQTYARVEQNQPLAVADVKALAQAKVSDDLIISQIRASRTVYHLSVADIIDLRNSGVSEKVLDFMINTPSTIGGTSEVAPAPATTISQPPPPAPVDTVVAAPGRITFGLVAIGYGMAAGFGVPAIGVIHPTRTQSGCAAPGGMIVGAGIARRDAGVEKFRRRRN